MKCTQMLCLDERYLCVPGAALKALSGKVGGWGQHGRDWGLKSVSGGLFHLCSAYLCLHHPLLGGTTGGTGPDGMHSPSP